MYSEILAMLQINSHPSSTPCCNSPTSLTAIAEAKAVPLDGMKALGGERRYSSYSFTTSALDGGEWSATRPGRALPLGNGPLYPLYRRLGGPQSRSGHRG
jgi:hypothetical protein